MQKIVIRLTVYIAKNMKSAVKQSFPEATLINDRFHVIKFAMEAAAAEPDTINLSIL